MTEFRFAYLPEPSGIDERGIPAFSGAQLMTDSAQLHLLAAYLFNAPLAMEDEGYLSDALAPHRRHAVPFEFRTDGGWLWSGAVTYYLRWHRCALDAAFRRQIVANGYQCPQVADDVLRSQARGGPGDIVS